MFSWAVSFADSMLRVTRWRVWRSSGFMVNGDGMSRGFGRIASVLVVCDRGFGYGCEGINCR